MPDFKGISGALLKTISAVLDTIEQSAIDQLLAELQKAERIFVCGAGRSGLAGRFFAMRLMHLGRCVYMAGDTTTPGIRRGDLLLLISRSGTTATVVNAARVAGTAGAHIVSLVAQGETGSEHPLARLSNLCLALDLSAAGVQTDTLNRYPQGTVFELSALAVLESLLSCIIAGEKITGEEMQQRHANME